MIISEPTRYGAGMYLYGDYWDLHSLHKLIHRLADGYPIEGELVDFLLSLAYEIRHAYQGDRLEESFGFDELDQVNYRGVPLLWPVLIPQIGLLRWAAAYHPTSKKDQATLLILEHCVEDSLIEYDKSIGDCVYDLRTMFDWLNKDYYVQFVYKCAYSYLFDSKGGKARFKRLPLVLRMMHPSSNEYRIFAEHLESRATELGTSPHNLQDWSTWPDFRW
ncbi:DUF6904 family protein [Desulfatibacillum aliphaticivorans]|uniref:DUF6904 family protein n=1 Tax=Desulfatibacillum aliphaticivorans TaxID=218208 RepID=UPI00068899A5|nr:hypothetical protein [Desulfatibacillum aliphaticivorans]